MTGVWPEHPVIYEINTAVWLTQLSGQHGRPVTLANVTAADWAEVTPSGVDAVWLMGVWERSPVGRSLALSNPQLMDSFREALPDLSPADVIGSPYCVRRYIVDESFGGTEALAAARATLAEGGVRLVLDYVPNHVAPDHPWTSTRPELFVQGGPDDLAAGPDAWLSVAGHVFAHGRDPYFPPWPDVVQLDAFAPELRTATVQTLTAIADQCDGIRCDMAMLMMNSVFAKTWGGRTGNAPTEEFWPTVIAQLRQRHSEIMLIAEAYWNLERDLIGQGFDRCYDKRLYDRVIARDISGVRDHLRADLGYQSHMVRFLENHDEPRVAARLPEGVERAAAVAVGTLPGATLWHEGQFEGRRVRPPVFLSRRPAEPADAGLDQWYRRLLGAVGANGVRTGTWRLLEPTGWPDNMSCRQLLAWSWSQADGRARHLVVVNLSDRRADCQIPLDWPELPGRTWQLHDLLTDVVYERDGAGLGSPGLYVALEPGEANLFVLR